MRLRTVTALGICGGALAALAHAADEQAMARELAGGRVFVALEDGSLVCFGK